MLSDQYSTLQHELFVSKQYFDLFHSFNDRTLQILNGRPTISTSWNTLPAQIQASVTYGTDISIT